tara:strand:+ start:3480 stop:4484 length:1005 start_codon:yes stop_codon:yes gene_type:complete
MIIILEGPDGVGKTTLAKELCKQLKATYLHLGYRWKDKMFDYHTAAIRYAARQNKPVIIDRWWPSEAIYAEVYRNGSKWPLQGRMADRIARKFGAVYVYCLPDNKHAKRFEELKKKRYEMYTDMSKISELFNKLWYGDKEHTNTTNHIDFLIRSGGLQNRDDHIMYKISEHGHYLDLFAERVIDLAKIRREQQYQPALDYEEWNMLGHLDKAEYLIVGEQVNPKHRELFWPFYEYGNSSLYLAQSMHDANIPEETIMFCNAYDHDQQINKHIATLASSGKLKVVTLGGHAADTVAELGVIPHKELPHPSYAKRFGKVNLTEVLKNVIVCKRCLD